MRVLRKKGLSAELKDNGKWFSENKFFQKHLTVISDIVRMDVSSASGKPLSVVFHRVAKEIEADEIIDTTINLGKSNPHTIN